MAHRDEYGVEPICKVLSEHGCTIAPSTFYDALSRRPSRRSVRDQQVLESIVTEQSRVCLWPGSAPGRCGFGFAARAMTWPDAPWNE
jgi:hypothetical protein